MLVDEAHIAMTLNHSNVVPVLDLGRAEGSYFLVMELVDGWDLAQVHERGRDAGYPVAAGAGAVRDGPGLPRAGLRPRPAGRARTGRWASSIATSARRTCSSASTAR